MINGHSMTEGIFSSNNFFGQDFGLDMDLVERIEIVRGPSSALYGSNGMLATINVVTRSPVDTKKLRVTTEYGSFGQRKIGASTSVYLGKGANLLLSGSVFNSRGQDFVIPQFNSPETNLGRADGVDGDRGYHTFANLVWQDWTVTAFFNSREKQPPVAWGSSVFPDRGASVKDSRNFVNAAYVKNLASTAKIRWQINYDNYHYSDRFDYREESAGLADFRTRALNDWVGTDLSYAVEVGTRQSITVGTQASFEIRRSQESYQVYPEALTQFQSNNPDRTVGVFFQDEITITKRLKAYTGLRWDESRNFGRYLSPRVALVFQSSPTTSYKFVYGQPFRNPSAYEQYFNDGGLSYLAPAGVLRRETAHTLELSGEKKVRANLDLVFTAYQYRMANLIQAQLVGGAQQYGNIGNFRSTGLEVEVSGRPWSHFEVNGSYSWQVANSVENQTALPNSPRHIAKLRFAIPLAKNRLQLSSGTQFLSRRLTRDGGSVGILALVDATITTRNLFRDFDLQFGLRNVANQRPFQPVSLVIDSLQHDGFAVFMKTIWHTRE